MSSQQEAGSGYEVVSRWYSNLGGLLFPIAAAVLAFFVGGLVVVATGHDPIAAYRAIFNGTGLNWFFPWVWGDERFSASLDLQQTLIITAPLMLTACAVAFAFRCGMFNIGGQGQYFVGLLTALYIGHAFAGMPRPLHILLATLGAIVGGVIIGLLEQFTGAYLNPPIEAAGINAGGLDGVMPFVALIVILMIRPHGLFGREQIQRV